MQTADVADELADVLALGLPPPVARALATAVLRRSGMHDDGSVGGAGLAAAVDSLEGSLPSYVADPERRSRCTAALRRMLTRRVAQEPARDQSAGDTIVLLSSEDIGRAAEAARALAARIGFGRLEQTRLATVTAELARNIVMYAVQGDITLAAVSHPRRGLQVMARDRGPGIPDIAHVMGPTYRSKTGMGMGLKGSKRLVDEFHVASTVGEGTRVVVRRYLP